MSEVPPLTEDALAKAAAAALSAEFGPHLATAVDKAARGELPPPSAEASRDLNQILGTAAAVVQLGWAVIEIAKFCWRKFQELRDKAKVAEAARAEIAIPGLPGETRDKIIDAVVDKL